jgi:hypothetical protein
LTSPTPYDPPLTYGGWTQSRALGARIATILRSRETDDEIPLSWNGEEQNGGDRRKRRHKVIIHTSPFLRCVQTSIAISAGLAQNPGHHHARPSSSHSIKALHSSPQLRPTIATGPPRLAPIPEPALVVNGKPKEQPENIKKSIIRIDAFLGEWLSPDYFEQITPPPSSIMMVAVAKADLLRREDYSYLLHIRNTSPNQGFPGGWGSPIVTADKDKDDGPLAHLSSLSHALPRRDRTSSLSGVGSHASLTSRKSATNLSEGGAGEYDIYQPPIPSYAISTSNSIPPGYVAHARDACVEVDYQWDSMREPQNWGNGGEYGEEWSSMHKRFRKGLQNLVNWYQNTEDPGKLLTKTPTSPGHARLMNYEDNSDDEDSDLVIILVTHGAGCNALIGALTNQPVLLDVGMASLTMAVRKATPVNSPPQTPGATTPKSHSRVSSRNIHISDQYDVKLVANTEHLRTNSNSTPISRTLSMAGVFTPRDRFGNSSLDGSSFKQPRTVPNSSNFGSIRRTSTVTGSEPRSYLPPRQSSIGLWSAPRPQEQEAGDPEDDMILNFGDDATESNPLEDETKDESAVTESEKDEEDDIAPLGLWGTPRPPGYAEKIREIAPKRRWTVNERA